MGRAQAIRRGRGHSLRGVLQRARREISTAGRFFRDAIILRLRAHRGENYYRNHVDVTLESIKVRSNEVHHNYGMKTRESRV